MIAYIWFPFLSSLQLITASIKQRSHSCDSTWTDQDWTKRFLKVTGISSHLIWRGCSLLMLVSPWNEPGNDAALRSFGLKGWRVVEKPFITCGSFPVFADHSLHDVVMGSRQTFSGRSCEGQFWVESCCCPSWEWSYVSFGECELYGFVWGFALFHMTSCTIVLDRIKDGIFHDLSGKLEANISPVWVHGGFSEQEQICVLLPLLGFTVEPKAISQGQLQQKTELPITSQCLRGKSISISTSDTSDPCGSRTWTTDLRATRSNPDNSCASSRPGWQNTQLISALQSAATQTGCRSVVNSIISTLLRCQGSEFIAQ